MNILWYEIFDVGFGLLMMWYYAKKRHFPMGTQIRCRGGRLARDPGHRDRHLYYGFGTQFLAGF